MCEWIDGKCGSRKMNEHGLTLYACRNQVVPFFLLLTSAIHSPQLPQSPSQTSRLPSVRRVSCGPWNAAPVAALTPCVKDLSYQNALFFRTSHRPGLQSPHQPSRLLPWPRTQRGVYKSPTNLRSCSCGTRSGSEGFISDSGGFEASSCSEEYKSGGSERSAK